MNFKFHPSTDKAYDLIENVLVDLLEVYEMNTHAGYVIGFKPVAGDYNKYINDVKGYNNKLYGVVGYKLACIVGLDKLVKEKGEGVVNE